METSWSPRESRVRSGGAGGQRASRRVPALIGGERKQIWNAQVVTSADPGADRQPDDAPRVNRLLALSDGVIAIALTLLVLQLRVPSASEVAHPDSAADLADQLSRDTAQLVSFVVSCYVIAQFWLVHRRVFRLVGEQEEGLEWWTVAVYSWILLAAAPVVFIRWSARGARG